MSLLIGFAGRMQSGKSTAAAMLVDRGDFQVISFAHPVKEMATALLMAGFGYSRQAVDKLMNDKNANIPELRTPMRYLLQSLGTDWGRNLIYQQMWMKSAERRAIGLLFSDAPWTGSTNVVFDDVRFDNEASMIRGLGGLIIHIRRDRLADHKLSHVSEIGINVGVKDRVIDNNGSVADFQAAVARAVDRFESGSDELLRWCLTDCADYRA